MGDNYLFNNLLARDFEIRQGQWQCVGVGGNHSFAGMFLTTRMSCHVKHKMLRLVSTTGCIHNLTKI